MNECAECDYFKLQLINGACQLSSWDCVCLWKWSVSLSYFHKVTPPLKLLHGEILCTPVEEPYKFNPPRQARRRGMWPWPEQAGDHRCISPFTTTSLDLPVRNNQPLSHSSRLSEESHCCVNGLFYSHMITGLTSATSAQVWGRYWHSSQKCNCMIQHVLEPKRRKLFGNECFYRLLSVSMIGPQQGECHPRSKAFD